MVYAGPAEHVASRTQCDRAICDGCGFIWLHAERRQRWWPSDDKRCPRERAAAAVPASNTRRSRSSSSFARFVRDADRPVRKKKLCRFADTSRSAIGLSHGSQIAGRQCSELVSLHPRLSVARRRCGCWCIQLLQGLRQDATTSTARYWAQLQQLLRAVYCGPASHKRRAALRTLLFGFARRDRMSGIFMTLSLPTADTVLHNLRILICKSVCSIM